MDKHILVFGTSTTYGAWDIEGGWVQRLRKFLDQKIIDSDHKEFYLVYNLGVSGDKSADILKRFEIETEARKGRHNEEVIILFHLGINDCIYNEQFGGLEVSSDEFKQNCLKLISLAKKHSQKIVVIGSMPVDSRVDPMPWSPGRGYRNEYVSQFNKVMEEVTRESKVHFIEVYKQFIDKDCSNLLADGVHMTTEGHRQFFKIVRDYLIAKRII